jgi:hypothetical protein
MLHHVLLWLLRQHDPDNAWEAQWADLSRVRPPPHSLGDRLREAVDRYPCDVLFVHRDQEAAPLESRRAEIAAATRSLSSVEIVPIVPVRMTEAWFLFDEAAIRKAAGNPSGRVMLDLPPLASMETRADPKQMLIDLLEVASEQTGRRLAKLRPGHLRHRVAELIDDFAPLRALSAFGRLEQDVVDLVARINVRAELSE